MNNLKSFTKICEVCKSTFQGGNRARYCKKCLTKHCEYCGKNFFTKMAHIKQGWGRYCSQSCNKKANPIDPSTITYFYGKNHHNWKNGKTTHSAGYILLNISGTKLYEHRVVMEKHLGRKLDKREQVHHINGNKQDNRLENLKIIDLVDHLVLEHKVGTYKKHLDILHTKASISL